MIDAVSLYLLPDVLRSFREAHPELEVEISVDRSGVLADRLGRHELDLAFLIGPLDEGFGGERIAIEALRAYGPPGMRLPRPDAEWFLYPRGSRTRRLIDAGLAREGIEPQVTLESSNPQVLRQLVALGLGWAVLPEAVAGTGDPPLPRSGVPRLAEREVLLAWRLSGPPRAAAAALYSFVAGPR